MDIMQQSSYPSCDATSSQAFSKVCPNPLRANSITSDALAKLHKKKAKYKAYEKDLFGKQQKRHKFATEKESKVSPFPFSSHSNDPRSSFNSSYPQQFFSQSLPQMILPTQPQKPSAEANRNIAPFIAKLYTLVSSPETEHLIHWSNEHKNNAFVVTDAVEFATTLLPRFFKHSNFCSFVRQLNLYGFHKIASSTGYAFMHEHFRLSSPQLLSRIFRKKHFKKQKKDTQLLNSSQNSSKVKDFEMNNQITNQSPNVNHIPGTNPNLRKNMNSNAYQISQLSSPFITETSPALSFVPSPTIAIEKKVKDFLSDRQQDKSVTYQCLLEETERLKHKSTETHDRIIQLKEMLNSSQSLESRLVRCIEIIATQLTQRGEDLSSVMNLLQQNEQTGVQHTLSHSHVMSSDSVQPLNEPTVVTNHTISDDVGDSQSFFDAMETEQRHLELTQSEHAEVVLTEEPIVLNWRFEG